MTPNHSLLKSPTLSEISCTLLPGRYADGRIVPPLYNQAYRHWKKTWSEIFTRAGSPGSLCAENFLRQNLVITLHQGNRIAGILTTTFFNLSSDATFDHPYFQPFPRAIVEELWKAGNGLVITGEYLAVEPEFRKSIVGLSLADVLVGLLMKTFVQIGAKMTLATTVRPAKVHEICQAYGYSEVGQYEKYGLDCLLLQNTKEQYREHADPLVREMIESCWRKRLDCTGITSRKEMDILDRSVREIRLPDVA